MARGPTSSSALHSALYCTSSVGRGECKSVAKNCSACDVTSCAASALAGRRSIPPDGSRVESSLGLMKISNDTATHSMGDSSSPAGPCSTRLGAVHLDKVRPSPPAPRCFLSSRARRQLLALVCSPARWLLLLHIADRSPRLLADVPPLRHQHTLPPPSDPRRLPPFLPFHARLFSGRHRCRCPSAFACSTRSPPTNRHLWKPTAP